MPPERPLGQVHPWALALFGGAIGLIDRAARKTAAAA
jgi:hypothetical protein